MKSSPIDLKSLVGSIAINILPFIPLIFTYYSVAELFNMIIKSVVGP
jgi:hypothetical protein